MILSGSIQVNAWKYTQGKVEGSQEKAICNG
jgi:hypothetical protein